MISVRRALDRQRIEASGIRIVQDFPDRFGGGGWDKPELVEV